MSWMNGRGEPRELIVSHRNYLQSPYFFMCCNLYDVQAEKPAAAAPQTALAGTLVSSLHRLKDIDNTGESLSPSISRIICGKLTLYGVITRWWLLRLRRSLRQDGGRIPFTVQSVRDGQVRSISCSIMCRWREGGREKGSGGEGNW